MKQHKSKIANKWPFLLLAFAVAVIGCGGSGTLPLTGVVNSTGATSGGTTLGTTGAGSAGTTGSTTSGTTGKTTGSTSAGTTGSTTSGTTGKTTGSTTGSTTSGTTGSTTSGTTGSTGVIASSYHVTAIPITLNNVTDLGATPISINNSGVIVGNRENYNTEMFAFMYNPATNTTTDISGGNWTHAVAVNNSGLIVGNLLDSTYGYVTNGIYWSPGSKTFSKIPLVDGFTRTQINGLNDKGQITGQAIQGTNQVGVVWNINDLSHPTVLKSLLPAPDADTIATAINDEGQVVGYGVSPNTQDGPLYWSSLTAEPVELPIATFSENSANMITDSGLIIGVDGVFQVYWNGPKGVEESFGKTSIGQINPLGLGVGFNGSPCLWTLKAGVARLAGLLDKASQSAKWNVTSAYAISDNGWIAGVGSYSGTTNQQFGTIFLAKPATPGTRRF